MTREEAINYAEAIKAKTQEKIEFYRRGNAHAPEVYYSDLAFLSAAISALREQEERRWIPVTERLPEKNGQWVLCLCVSGAIEVLKFDYTMWNWDAQYPGRCYLENYVTHWMPLPEPPKGE